jgi:hypothetical protein
VGWARDGRALLKSAGLKIVALGSRTGVCFYLGECLDSESASSAAWDNGKGKKWCGNAIR